MIVFFAFLIFSGFLFGDEIHKLIKVQDRIWKTDPPHEIAGFGSYDNALIYVNILNSYNTFKKVRKNINGVLYDWYAGERSNPSGGFFLHNGFRSFIPAIDEKDLLATYQSSLASFERDYRKAYPVTRASLSLPLSESERQYQNARKTLTWPENCPIHTENIRFGNETVQIVTENCMKELVKKTLSIEGNIVCRRTINQHGEQSSETVAIYTIAINGKDLLIVKQYPQNKQWGERKFGFFRKALTTPTGPILLPDTESIVTFCLPIGLWNIGEIYLEILHMASGRSAIETLKDSQERNKRQIWAILGKTLGILHQKLGKFNRELRQYQVPQLDYQLKNIFLDDNFNVTLIDLDCLGKDPVKELDHIIKHEILLITRNMIKQADGTFSETDIESQFARVYIDGYLSTFATNPALQAKLRTAIAQARLPKDGKTIAGMAQQQQTAAAANQAQQLQRQAYDPLLAAGLEASFQEELKRAKTGDITEQDRDCGKERGSKIFDAFFS